MLDDDQEAKMVILANGLLRHSERAEKYNEYDKPTVFGCSPGACAADSNCAHDNFDLLWFWLAARLRGPAT